MYNYYNPQQNYSTNIFSYVNGIEGAKAYIMQPNSTVVLLDSESPRMYLKTSDYYGRASLKAYRLEEETADVPRPMGGEYVTRKEFEELKAKYEQLFTNIATYERAKPATNGEPNATNEPERKGILITNAGNGR